MLLTVSYKPSTSSAKMSIPDLFKCPISLDLFTDPVTLCTGQTYDRPWIEKWISSGNLTCPVTMLSLHDRSMVPNITLSHLITQWLNQIPKKSPPPEPDYYLAVLKQTLQSQDSILEKKIQALKQLNLLSVENEGLIKFGFLELFLELAFQTHQRLELVELALAAAVKLAPLGDLRGLNVVEDGEKFECLLNLLEQGTPLIKINLCHLLEAGLDPSSPSSMIRNSVEIQQSVLNLINSDEENAGVSEAAVKFMLAICLSHQTPEKLVQLGGVSSLVRYIIRSLKRDRSRGLGYATEAIKTMMEAEGGKEALLKEKNGVKTLVRMVFRVCDHEGSESAIKSLICLCCDSREAREEAVKDGVLTQLLLLLQSQGSVRAKAEARMLLKLLRIMWAKDPVAVVC